MGPLLRRRTRRDEPLLSVALLIAALVSLGGAVAHLSRVSVAATVFTVTAAASMGRQGFDSILQRDAPAAARGRSFARFETLFQLAWVLGALSGVGPQLNTRSGLAVLGVVFVLALVAYLVGAGRHHQRGAATSSATVACVMSDDDYHDLLDELREASIAYEDAYADCPRERRLTSRTLCEAADRLRDVAVRYGAERDRRRTGAN